MSGTEVILLRSTNVGAPALNGIAGSLIALLDACLVNGYNSKTPSGITRTGAVATVTFATAHGFAVDGLTKVLQEGWDQAEYNGIFKISNVTTLSYDITVSGAPVTPGTGTTITSKAAPLGWSKAFAGTNKAAYRGNDVTGTRLYMRVDDNNPNVDTNKTATIRGYEIMTDVDTGTGLFPTTAQMANGIHLNKSSTSDSTARPWVLVGDGFEFFLFSANNPSYADGHQTFHFGDPASEMTSDPYGCLIYGATAAGPSGSPDANNSAQAINTGAGSLGTAQAGHFYARNFTQVGTSSPTSKHGNITVGGNPLGAVGVIPYPAPANNALYVSPIFTAELNILRGQLKGIWQPLHSRPLGHAVAIAANVSPINRRLYSVTTAYSGGTLGETHVDIDGPWR